MRGWPKSRCIVALALALPLVLSGCSEEKKKKREQPPHPASFIEGCEVPPPSHGPEMFSRSLSKDISGLGSAWGLIMMANPDDGAFGQELEDRIEGQVQQLLADLDVSPQETVYAGTNVPAVSMKITPARKRVIESLPYVCSVADDRGYWPTE